MGNDVDVYAVFGLEAPAEQETNPAGEQEQEIAAPADAGEQEQEIAEPAADEPDPEADEPEQEPEKQPLTKEQRHAAAKKRREEEIREAVEQALQAERQKQKEREAALFKKAKMKNNFSGTDILSLDDLEKWDADQRTADINKRMKAGQLTAEDMQQLIEESPTMRQVRAQNEQLERDAQESRNQLHAQTLEREIAEIRKLNPNIQSLTDIIRMPTGKIFAGLVENMGMSYVEAYEMANHKALREQQAKVAAAGAKMASGGKEHLRRTEQRGAGGMELPADVAANYKIFFPDASETEIRKMYEKNAKR